MADQVTLAVNDHIAEITLDRPAKHNAVTPEMAAAGVAALWQRYDSLRTRTLLIRGAESDLLKRDTALAMTQRGPKATLKEIEGVGHAPTLVAPAQIALVKEFLAET